MSSDVQHKIKCIQNCKRCLGSNPKYLIKMPLGRGKKKKVLKKKNHDSKNPLAIGNHLLHPSSGNHRGETVNKHLLRGEGIGVQSSARTLLLSFKWPYKASRQTYCREISFSFCLSLLTNANIFTFSFEAEYDLAIIVKCKASLYMTCFV